MGMSKKPWWVLGIVHKGSYGYKETIFVAWGPGPNGPQPSARRSASKSLCPGYIKDINNNNNIIIFFFFN